MRRQAAIVVAGGVALGLGAATVALATKLESEQTMRRQQVDSALAEQRRAAHSEDLEPTAPDPAPARRTICVRGVDTFASTAGIDSVLDASGKLNPDALAWLSTQAARAERRAELESAGPGLPQRLGRTRKDDGWVAIEPPTRPCEDTTAYAALSIDTQRPTDVPSGAK